MKAPPWPTQREFAIADALREPDGTPSSVAALYGITVKEVFAAARTVGAWGRHSRKLMPKIREEIRASNLPREEALTAAIEKLWDDE